MKSEPTDLTLLGVEGFGVDEAVRRAAVSPAGWCGVPITIARITIGSHRGLALAEGL